MPTLRSLVAALTLAAMMVAAPTVRAAEGAPLDAVAADVRAGRPLVVYVVVPLCSNAQIDCGSDIAGRPAGLEHNVYWGAVFGARRFFERKNSGWERVERRRGQGVFLERGIYRRFVSGAPWGRAEDVEEIVVLEAVHGDAIDQAVDHLWRTATGGGRISFQDGERRRDERILVTGYAGHNRLMDGKTLPEARGGAPVPSFVLACKSEPYFGPSLRAAGSSPLVMTSTLMAPEGYLIDAIARGIGERLDPAELRRRAVAAYAKWQKLTPRQAGSVFAKR
ncbi:Hypothetical protein A7982_03989 [Minicystis rosea]|nr:Hypothetical protein A7982_03989 [Minicystis rosea]